MNGYGHETTTTVELLAVQRRILGIAAIITLIGAVVLWYWEPDSEGPWGVYWQSSLSFCWRMGAVLAAAWLAYDDVQRIPGWLLVLMPFLLIVLVRSPRILWPIIPLLIVYAVLRRVLMPPKRKDRR